MIKLDFSGNWKLNLQNKILGYSADQRKQNAIYLEDETHYVVFVLDERHGEIVRISGDYKIDQTDKCLLTSFEKEGESADTPVSADMILPFFLLLQFISVKTHEDNRKCTKGDGYWTVHVDNLPVLFRSELAAKSFCYGVPLDVSKRIDASSEEEQRRFFAARKKAGQLPRNLRNLGIPWITELIPGMIKSDSAGSAISKKFS